MSRIAALILAAGEASRFRAAAGEGGPATKLVALYRGKPIVGHVAEAARDAGLAPIVAVTGFAQEAVTAALGDLALHVRYNPDYATGMASSLKVGLAALPDDVDGVVILLGDMPLVSPHLIAQLTDAFADHPHAVAVAPVHDGVRGNPVLLSRALFAELQMLKGDAGARQVLRGRDAEVVEIVVDEAAARLDVDTPDALRDLPDA